MSTATEIRKSKNTVKDHRNARAARGLKPGDFADEAEIMANFAEESAEADALLESINAIRPGRQMQGGGNFTRVALVTTTMKLPVKMVSEVKAKASERGIGYSKLVRELIWLGLRSAKARW